MNLGNKLTVFSNNCSGETVVTKIERRIIQWFIFLFKFIDNSRDFLELHKSWSKGWFSWRCWVIESVDEYFAGRDPWFTTVYDWDTLRLIIFLW